MVSQDIRRSCGQPSRDNRKDNHRRKEEAAQEDNKAMNTPHILPRVDNYHRPEDYDTYENTYQAIPIKTKHEPKHHYHHDEE